MIFLNGAEVVIEHFPDGTLLMKQSVERCQQPSEILWRFENNEEMIALMYLVRHLQCHGIKDIWLIMPYIPNARQDRVKTDEDVFTLKYFAEFINSLGFSRVIVTDPHSSVSEALINNISVQFPDLDIDYAIEWSNANFLFFPDEGAMKRYAGAFTLPYAFGIKNRNWKTGSILSLEVAGSVDAIKGATILIVDDICSRGSTFFHSAKKLKELGAGKIYLYVTHCENTILQVELLESDLIERVFTTRSIFTANHDKIEVTPGL